MKYDVIVIGGGIVGLATALKIKERSRKIKIAVLEKEGVVAQHQTGNNSGVIHAGVYYKPGSLRAINCRTGYKLLVEFCIQHEITHDICGKLIIATRNEELPRLNDLYSRALQNGLERVRKIPGEAIKEYEPHATGSAALWVPYTGIVDFKEVAQKFADVFVTKHGGEIYTNHEVLDIRQNLNGVDVLANDIILSGRLVINTAGLFADKIARFTEPDIDVRIIPFRGEYFMLKEDRAFLVRNLIYPVPDPRFPFLGVHFTRRIHGGIEAGPNAVWAFKREGYRMADFDLDEFTGALLWKGFRKIMRQYWRTGLGEYYRSFNRKSMARALQRLVPELETNDLIKGNSGVRALACSRDGGIIDDFLIAEGKNTINVLNAPSPAATASLSIGEAIAAKAFEKHLEYP